MNQPNTVQLGPIASAVHQQEVQVNHLARVLTAIILKCGTPDILSVKRVIKLDLTKEEFDAATAHAGGWMMEQKPLPDGGVRFELVQTQSAPAGSKQ